MTGTESAMAERRVGDRPVSAVALGGARWSLTERPDEALAVRTVHAALDAGITLFDTAPAYAPPGRDGHNELLLARALRQHPLSAGVFVSTKGGHHRAGTDFPVDARPEVLERDCRDSLRRLGVEQIDLYLLHWPDPAVPIAESVGALAALRAAGLVARIGVCNVDTGQLAQALAVTSIDAVQNCFSPLRTEGRPVLERCTRDGIAYLAYSPFGGPPGATGLASRCPEFARVAAERGVSVHEVALAWLLAQSPVLLPVVGAGRPSSVAAAARASRLALDPAELARLDDGIAS